MVGAACAGARRRPPRARRPRRPAKRSRTLRRLVLTCTWRPVSGSIDPEVADRRQLELARVADLDGEHAVAPAQRAQRAFPVARRRGSPRRRRRARGRARARPSCVTAPPERRSRRRRRPRARRAARASSPSRPSRPWRGRSTRGSPVAEREHAEPVAAARGHVADRRAPTPSATSALRRSAVPKLIEAETSSSSQRGHRALADVHAHVRLAHARGHVPVDVAHVVARPVGADHRQVGAAADLRREVLARDQALDAPQDREVERAQDRGGTRARARGARACARARGGTTRRRAAHGSRPVRSSERRRPPSSSTSAPPANAAVTSCFSLRVEKRVPRFA